MRSYKGFKSRLTPRVDIGARFTPTKGRATVRVKPPLMRKSIKFSRNIY